MKAIDWSPGPTMNPKMNTVAVLMVHITGVLHDWMDLALDTPPSRVRAQKFQTHGVSGDELLRRLGLAESSS